MNEFLVLSLDCPSSADLSMNGPTQIEATSAFGVACYPDDDTYASVTKQIETKNLLSINDSFKNLTKARSSTFFCRIYSSTTVRSHKNGQPFTRSYAGKDWVFMHRGDLNKSELQKLLDSENIDNHQPVGNTDSEMIFCYLLNKMQLAGVDRLKEVSDNDFKNWVAPLEGLGSLDLILSDQHESMVYKGSFSPEPIYIYRSLPPRSSHTFNTERFKISLNNPKDQLRTFLLISSSPSSSESFYELQPGELLRFRRGYKVSRNAQNHTESRMVTSNFSTPIMAQSQSAPVVCNIRSTSNTPEGKQLAYRTFDVTHITNYQYAMPVERSSHTIRMQPVEDSMQEVLTSELHFSPHCDVLRFEDVFGNQALYALVEIPYTEFQVKSHSRVRIFDTPPLDFSHEVRKTTIPLSWMPWQRQMLLPFLLPPELPEPQLTELTDYARSFVDKGDFHLMDTLSNINQHIFQDYTYAQGQTNLKTTPFEVYQSRTGVCQDFANLFICLARLLNIPARYRVGYVHTGADYTNRIQSEASHAWAEAYLPYVGWKGFDPTNGKIVSQEHIRVACGRNYKDATPTVGTIFKGGGIERLTVTVKVTEVTS